MTTIAYRDGILAGDSQSDWFYMEKGIKKIFKKGNVLVGFAGEMGKGEIFCHWIFNKGPKPDIGENFSAIVVKDGKCYCYDSILTPLETESYSAIGSGARYAIAAMDLGMSAKDAIKSAKKRDIHTGGHIHTLKT